MQPMPEMEQPSEIVMPLLPYQRQFLAWAVSQERSSVQGGILADEMGMGKTLQVLGHALRLFHVQEKPMRIVWKIRHL